MKKIFLFLSLILSLAVHSQTEPPTSTYTKISTTGYNWLRGYFRALHVPAGATPILQTNQWTGSGAVFVDSINHRFYFYSGGIWRYGGEIDSIGRRTGVDSFDVYKNGVYSYSVKDSTGGAATNNTNAGAFYRWLKPSTQEIKTFAEGYGFLLDSAANADALTARLDSATVFPHIRSSITVLFDSIGVDGFSPMTVSGSTFQAKRISATGGLTIGETPSGGLVIDATSITPETYDVQYVNNDADMTGTIAYNTTLRRLTVKDTILNFYYHLAITDSVTTIDTTYDADAVVYMDNVESAGRALTEAEKIRISDLFEDLKTAGVYSIIYDAGLPIWGSSAPSLVTLKGTVTVTASGSPTFASDGVDFNGSTQYLNTSILPSTAGSVTSMHHAYYSQDDVTSSTMIDMGSSTGTNRFQMFILATTTGQISRMFTSANQASSARGGGSNGFAVGSRVSSSDFRIFWNGSQTGSAITAAGGTLPTHAVYVGAENDDGVAATFSARKCSFWSLGGGLTPTQVSDFTTAIESFMDAMGIGQIP